MEAGHLGNAALLMGIVTALHPLLLGRNAFADLLNPNLGQLDLVLDFRALLRPLLLVGLLKKRRCWVLLSPWLVEINQLPGQ